MSLGTRLVAAAILLRLGALSSLATEPQDAVRHARGGYKECVGTVAGHAQAGSEIRVCLDGNGTYRQLTQVTAILTGRDWFPANRFQKFPGEIRLTCGSKAQPRLAVVLPAVGESAGRFRVELPCVLGATEVARAMHVARNLLLLSLKDRAGFARRAALHTGGCTAGKASESCATFEKLAAGVAAGKGNPLVNGRPFHFALGGFEFRAGLAAAPEKLSDDIDSPDPATRVRGLLGARDEMDDHEWRDRVNSAFEKLPREAQLKLIDETLDSPDANARNWAMDNLSMLPEAKRAAAAAHALDDSDQEVRSKAIPIAITLGDAAVTKALRDPDVANRMLAFDFLTSDSSPTASRAPASTEEATERYLQMGLADPDETIREMAQGRLDFLRQQQEYKRMKAPGWEDGKNVREVVPAAH